MASHTVPPAPLPPGGFHRSEGSSRPSNGPTVTRGGASVYSFPPKSLQSRRHQDLADSAPRSIEDCRDKLATFVMLTLQRRGPVDRRNEKLTWDKVDIVESHIQQKALVKDILRLDKEERRSYSERYSKLKQKPHSQVCQLIDRYNVDEPDQRFQWTLRQLVTEIGPSSEKAKKKKGNLFGRPTTKNETKRIILYLERAPGPEEDVIDMAYPHEIRMSQRSGQRPSFNSINDFQDALGPIRQQLPPSVHFNLPQNAMSGEPPRGFQTGGPQSGGPQAGGFGNIPVERLTNIQGGLGEPREPGGSGGPGGFGGLGGSGSLNRPAQGGPIQNRPLPGGPIQIKPNVQSGLRPGQQPTQGGIKTQPKGRNTGKDSDSDSDSDRKKKSSASAKHKKKTITSSKGKKSTSKSKRRNSYSSDSDATTNSSSGSGSSGMSDSDSAGSRSTSATSISSRSHSTHKGRHGHKSPSSSSSRQHHHYPQQIKNGDYSAAGGLRNNRHSSAPYAPRGQPPPPSSFIRPGTDFYPQPQPQPQSHTFPSQLAETFSAGMQAGLNGAMAVAAAATTTAANATNAASNFQQQQQQQQQQQHQQQQQQQPLLSPLPPLQTQEMRSATAAAAMAAGYPKTARTAATTAPYAGIRFGPDVRRVFRQQQEGLPSGGVRRGFTSGGSGGGRGAFERQQQQPQPQQQQQQQQQYHHQQYHHQQMRPHYDDDDEDDVDDDDDWDDDDEMDYAAGVAGGQMNGGFGGGHYGGGGGGGGGGGVMNSAGGFYGSRQRPGPDPRHNSAPFLSRPPPGMGPIRFGPRQGPEQGAFARQSPVGGGEIGGGGGGGERYGPSPFAGAGPIRGNGY